MLKQPAAALVVVGLLATSAMAQSIPYVQTPKKTFRLAHGLPPGSPYDLGAKRFAELVEVYSRGVLKVDVFPSAQLGAEQATAKDVQLGTLDMAIVPTNNASMWYKPLDIFNMPFIFVDRHHVDRIVRGPTGKEIFEEYRKASGNRIISIFEWGNRALMNNIRPINAPADMRGIKFRVPKNSVMVDTYQALGANPTAIDWGDLYGALQQKVADGLEGPPQGMIDNKFTDFLKYYSYVDPFFGVVLIIVNDKIFSSLTPEDQKALTQAGFEAGEYQRWISAKSHVNGLAALQKAGVTVNMVANRKPFVDAVKPIWDKYRPIIGEKWFTAFVDAGK
jgi:tripartite ATP-independent transporter DctP family solute receptor